MRDFGLILFTVIISGLATLVFSVFHYTNRENKLIRLIPLISLTPEEIWEYNAACAAWIRGYRADLDSWINIRIEHGQFGILPPLPQDFKRTDVLVYRGMSVGDQRICFLLKPEQK